MFITQKKLNAMIEEAVHKEREQRDIQEQFNSLYIHINEMQRTIDERFNELQRAIITNANN